MDIVPTTPEQVRHQINEYVDCLVAAFEAMGRECERIAHSFDALGLSVKEMIAEEVAQLNQTQRAIYFARLRCGEFALDVLADLNR